MSQWCDEAMREDRDVCTTEPIKDDGELDCEEAVRAEEIGECLDLHVKCPCGKGYQMILSGQNCYYKLISIWLSSGFKTFIPSKIEYSSIIIFGFQFFC
ncbi:hypothetical protein QQP08_018077 [Theobroma cacao]|nr:hypothetical protein QQP08_018077 [Theobroma cacao]